MARQPDTGSSRRRGSHNDSYLEDSGYSTATSSSPGAPRPALPQEERMQESVEDVKSELRQLREEVKRERELRLAGEEEILQLKGEKLLVYQKLAEYEERLKLIPQVIKSVPLLISAKMDEVCDICSGLNTTTLLKSSVEETQLETGDEGLPSPPKPTSISAPASYSQLQAAVKPSSNSSSTSSAQQGGKLPSNAARMAPPSSLSYKPKPQYGIRHSNKGPFRKE